MGDLAGTVPSAVPVSSVDLVTVISDGPRTGPGGIEARATPPVRVSAAVAALVMMILLIGPVFLLGAYGYGHVF